MRTAEIGRVALACGALGVLLAAPAAAVDLVSPSYRLRGLHIATTGPGWLTSSAPTPTISRGGVALGQPEAIGYGLPASGLTATWTGFWPLVVGAFPNHDLDGDGIPSLTDSDDDGDGVSDTAEVFPLSGPGTNPLDPDSDNDGLCDGPPSSLPACVQGGEDSDGDGFYDVGTETNPNNPDTDGDGSSDGAERLAGTNPLDPGSHPGLPPLPTGVPALQGLGLSLLTGAIGLLGITRLRKRGRA